MKKILFVIDKLSGGGAERVTTKLASELAEAFDNEVSILVSYHTEKSDYTLSDQVRVIYVDDRLERGGNRIIYLLKKVKTIVNIVKEGGYDALVSLAMPELNCYVMLAAKLAKIKKVILSERNDPARYPAGKIMRVLRNVCYHFADNIVFQTNGAKQYFSKKIQEKGAIISNPIEEKLPAPYIGVRKQEVVTFCRLEPQKNLTLLIDAFCDFWQEHQEYSLTIYGSGVLEEDLKQYIASKECRDYMQIKPFCADVHSRVLDASMYVLSSDYEGVSNAMLESLAIGLPTISTDSPPGGAREFIRTMENGILVPVNDRKSLAEAMAIIANDSELQEKFSKESIKIKEQLSVRRISTLWMEIIEKNKR